MVQTYKYIKGYYDVGPLMTLEKYKKIRDHALRYIKQFQEDSATEILQNKDFEQLEQHSNRRCRDWIIKYIQEQVW